jgi:chromosome segregation ATPase
MALTGMLLQRDSWQNQPEHPSYIHAPGLAAVEIPEQIGSRHASQASRSGSYFIGADIEQLAGTGNPDYANELEAMRARIIELQEQVARKTAAARIIDAHMKTVTAQAASAQERIADLEIELGATQEALVRQENDNCSLQSSLDLMIGENARLSRRLLEECTACDTVSTRLDRVNTTLTATDAEREKLIAAAAAADKKHQIETDDLEARLKATTSRAVAAETLLAEVQQTLRVCTEEKNQAERKAIGATLARNLAENELKSVQEELQTKERELLEYQQARSKLMIGLSSLLQNFKAREAALAAAKEKIQSLGERLKAAEARLASYEAKTERPKFFPQSDFASPPSAFAPVQAQVIVGRGGREAPRQTGDDAKRAALTQPPSAASLLAETISF